MVSDRRGLATGMAVLGFGSGALITAPVATNLMEAVGISSTYYILGISYFMLMLLGALYIAPPKRLGRCTKCFKITVIHLAKALAQMSAREAVRTKQFWMLWAMHLINVTAGFNDDFCCFTNGTRSCWIIGSWGCNNGRINGIIQWWWSVYLWAVASDYIGRHNVFVIFFIIQLVAFVTLPFTTNVLLFQALIFLVVSCYGGGFSNLPAFASDLFGTKQLGVIHGYLLTTWSLGGVFGPLIVSAIRNATNSYIPVFYTFSVLIAISFCISLWIRRDVTKKKKQQTAEQLQEASAM